jgi:succinoglycan biosynthesis protein ExoA
MTPLLGRSDDKQRAKALASVIVPMRDEAPYIGECLARLSSQSYGVENIEVLVADGRSGDGSARLAAEHLSSVPYAKAAVVENDERRRSTGLNGALELAEGAYILRVDCRARIPTDYVERCVATLERDPEVGVVGGAQVTAPRSERWSDLAVARSLNNRLGMGGSRYRSGRASGRADTVWMGAFRRTELKALGGWPTEIDVNEDYELNRRFRAAGKLVWFDADIRSYYVPRGTMRQVVFQYFQYGRAKGTWWRSGQPVGVRHVVLLGTPAIAGLAMIEAWRRLGTGRALAGLVGLGITVDAVGSPQPASAKVRFASGLLTPTVAVSWWLGAVSALVRRRPPPARAGGGPPAGTQVGQDAASGQSAS